MYLEYFGLDRPPFKITPDASMFFSGGERGDALDALIYAILNGEGIVKVVGEVGSGKTMLCRMLELKLPDEVEIVYIANPVLSPENILHVIAFELGLDITEQTGKLEVMQKIQSHLLKKYSENHQIVVFVEEAQGMPIATLEEIRLLSNLETDQHKLLQIVLFGQPELDENLKKDEIRQLKERITHSFFLKPFSMEEVSKYLNFRMTIAGYHGPDIFSEKTAKIIWKYSNGLLRRINILADKALLSAYAEQTHNVGIKHIKAAADDSEFSTNLTKSKKLPIFQIIIIALLILIALEIAFHDKIFGRSQKNQITTLEEMQEPTQEQINTTSALNKSHNNTNSKEATKETSQELKLERQIPPLQTKVIENISDPKTTSPQKPVAYEKTRASQKTGAIQIKIESAEKDTAISSKESQNPPDKKPISDKNESKISPTKQTEEISTVNTSNTSNTSEKNKISIPPKSLLAEKIKETNIWLKNGHIDSYTIQLMAVNQRHINSVHKYLRNLSNEDIYSDIHIYTTDSKSGILFGILYKEFSNKDAAINALSSLPTILNANNPILRTVHGIQKETGIKPNEN